MTQQEERLRSELETTRTMRELVYRTDIFEEDILKMMTSSQDVLASRIVGKDYGPTSFTLNGRLVHLKRHAQIAAETKPQTKEEFVQGAQKHLREARSAVRYVCNTPGGSRELSLARTKLDEATFWLKMHLDGVVADES